MNNIIYEYVPSENIAKVDINDFETLLEIKDSYEKLIRKVPNNVLQQRIDKAIEELEKEKRSCPASLTLEKAYIIEVEKITKVLSILRGEDNEQ